MASDSYGPSVAPENVPSAQARADRWDVDGGDSRVDTHPVRERGTETR